MKKIYVIHKYSSDPAVNREIVRKICKALLTLGYCPVAPQLALGDVLDDHLASERVLIMASCKEFMKVCDEAWVFSEATAGVSEEIDFAKKNNIPVFFIQTDMFLNDPEGGEDYKWKKRNQNR